MQRVHARSHAVVQNVDGARRVRGRVALAQLRGEHGEGSRLRRHHVHLPPALVPPEQTLQRGRRARLDALDLAARLAHALAVLAKLDAELLEVKRRPLVHRAGELGVLALLLERAVRLGVRHDLVEEEPAQRQQLEVRRHLGEVLQSGEKHVALDGVQVAKRHGVRAVGNLALLVQRLDAENLPGGDDLLAADRHALAHDEHAVAPVPGHDHLLLRRERLLLDGERELNHQRLRALLEKVNLGDPRVHTQRDLRAQRRGHLP